MDYTHTQLPESEDDLRPISLTPFLSKVTEQFVVKWLLQVIEDKIDFRQYGGLRGNSVTHYLIEFVNFILTHQDDTEKKAVVACMVDFHKAFNRQNHAILVEKLADMGVPGWLLRIVVGFLSQRTMVVRYKDAVSSVKQMPGGGPQGTLLGLILFLVLINDVGFSDQVNNAGELLCSKRSIKQANEMHLKFVDDVTYAEAVQLSDKTEATILQEQLSKTEEYAVKNEMKLNSNKTKVMVFNPCNKKDFHPSLSVSGAALEVVEVYKLLGLIVQSDLKWSRNTEEMVKRAYRKLWMLRRLKQFGAQVPELLLVYVAQIRCLLEYVVPVWQGAITEKERTDLERVQKSALRIILGEQYGTYNKALKTSGLLDLETRRVNICNKFAQKATKNKKHQNWFKLKPQSKTRNNIKYCIPRTRTERLKKSSIPYLTSLLNKKTP